MKQLNNAYSRVVALILSAGLLSSAHVNAITNNVNAYQGNPEASHTASSGYSEGELAQMLAPVALYPDSLLAHVMVAATYPLDLVQLYRFNEENINLSIDDKMQYAQSMGWDPSLITLLGFPRVLAQMHNDLDWTISLGNAFSQNEAAVLDTVQILRRDAQAANSLQNLKNVNVTYINQQIIIEPHHHNRIYVPIYSPLKVYGHWRWHQHQPRFWGFPRHVDAHPSIAIHWGRGININFDFYFGAFHWRNKHVLFSHHKNTRKYRSQHSIVSHSSAKRYRTHTQHRGVKRYAHQPNKPRHYANVLQQNRAKQKRNYNEARPHTYAQKQNVHHKQKVHHTKIVNHKQNVHQKQTVHDKPKRNKKQAPYAAKNHQPKQQKKRNVQRKVKPNRKE